MNKITKNMEKRGLEFSFAWLFAVIVGVFILFLAIFAVSKIIDTGNLEIGAKTGKEFGIILNPIESGIEDTSSNYMAMPVESRVYNKCDSSGVFGRQIVQVSQKSFSKWTQTNLDISFLNKYLYSEEYVEGKKFYLFSKQFNFPFKVSDLIIITEANKKYCFVEAPDNKTIKDSTNSVKVSIEVETQAGYKEGQAECYYSDSGTTDSYVLFLETNSYTHKQDLYLGEGSYTYYIKCLDLGGNPDEKTIKFNVDTDIEAPSVVRVFKEEGNLMLVTNEKAKCIYDSVDCSYLFKDGTKIDSNEAGKSHTTTWNTQSNLYIKCQDEYGNEPLPNQCSIVVRPFELHPGIVA